MAEKKIDTETSRLVKAKASLKSAIIAKGVAVDDSATIDTYAERVAEISGGGSATKIPVVGQWTIQGRTITEDELAQEIATHDLSEVTSLSYFASSVSGLTTIDLSKANFGTAKVKTMTNAFRDCKAKTYNLDGLDTSAVTDLSFIFYRSSISGAVDLSAWDTSSLTTLYVAFYYAGGITSLDVSTWTTPNLTALNGCFWFMSIKTLDLSSWNFSKVTTMQNCFNACGNLTTINFGDADFSSMGSGNAWSNFLSCANLTTIEGTISNIKSNCQINGPALTRESLLKFIDGLYDYSSGTAHTMTLKATAYARLTDEDIAIATDKGWTIGA